MSQHIDAVAKQSDIEALNGKTIKKMDFIKTTSANGNISLGDIIDTSKYTVISVSAYKTDAENEMVVCIPYQYTRGRPGRINGLHCISEFATYGVVADTSVTGVLFYAEI